MLIFMQKSDRKKMSKKKERLGGTRAALSGCTANANPKAAMEAVGQTNVSLLGPTIGRTENQPILFI